MSPYNPNTDYFEDPVIGNWLAENFRRKAAQTIGGQGNFAVRPEDLPPAQPQVQPPQNYLRRFINAVNPQQRGNTVRPPQMGNIDLYNRPRVQNPDGSVSSIRSMGFNIDGKEVLLPTVSDDGRIMSNEEAINQYRQT
mgnify:FL=1